ncbi:MAG: GNAT family N-acetyltransferase, partial [Rivularia sp. (in: cyanobacteria)]
MVEKIKSSYSFLWIDKVAEVPKNAWNALAVPLQTPFFEWDWLNNLEVSQSATA